MGFLKEYLKLSGHVGSGSNKKCLQEIGLIAWERQTGEPVPRATASAARHLHNRITVPKMYLIKIYEYFPQLT